VTIGEALDSLIGRISGQDVTGMSGTFARWEEVVGTTMAAHVKPVGLEGADLVLEVDHPAWATQVRRMAPEILTGLRDARALPEGTRSVRVRVR
jgi:predicted nucleic acid-binding Zn ribbon protein